MSASDPQSALAGRRVVEIADHKTAYGARLFADLGADVVLVEPPGGHATRRLRSPWFSYTNAGKRSVVLDLERAADRERFRALVASADLVFEGREPGTLAARGLGAEELRQANPRLVWTSITGFGQTGPQRSWHSSDLVAFARGGAAYVTGYAEDPPVRLAGSHAHVMASTVAASASMIALHHMQAGGLGQSVDVSVAEVVASMSHITGVGKWLDDGLVPRRAGTSLFASVPSGAYPCRDGLIYLMVNRPAHWKAVARWVFEETGQEAILSPLWEGPSAARIEDRHLIDAFISELTERHTVDEMYRQGQARHLAMTPLRGPAAVVDDPQLRAREYFVDVVADDGSVVRQPGPPYRFERTPARIRRRAPSVGEHDDEILATSEARRRASDSLRVPDPAPAPAAAAAMRGGAAGSAAHALAGLRIVEFSMGMAGPWIGRALAWCGADVIKVESRSHPDVTRQYVPPWAPHLGIQSRLSPWFTDWNAGKRFVALDLTRPEAVELALRLVAVADVVIENFTPGVLEKLGLGADELRRVKPDLVHFGTSGFGDDGPCRRYVTWGPNIEAASGLAASSGFAHRPGAMTHFAYPDSVSAAHGLFAVMSALEHRRRTGEGQRVHLSQLEAMVSVFGDVVMETLASGRDPERVGNRSRHAAPHGCYPCAGDDRWLAIAVFDEAEWKALCRVADKPGWLVDERFASMQARLENVDALDHEVAAWTADLDAYALETRLQEAGIAAGVAQTTEDQLHRDPQLAARGFFEEIEHKLKGKVVANGIPLGLTGTPGRTPHAGSAVGEDNDSVFGELLGVSADELVRLRAVGAVEDSDEIPPELP